MPVWRNHQWIAVIISVFALAVSVVSGFFAYRQTEIASQAYEASREQIVIRLTRESDVPVSAVSGIPLTPASNVVPPMVAATWRAEISNTSTTATATIVVAEVRSLGLVRDGWAVTGANRLIDPDRSQSNPLPLAIEPGRTAVLHVQAAVGVTDAAAQILRDLGLPQPIDRIQIALAEQGRDLFGNAASWIPEIRMYTVGERGPLQNPGVMLVVTTSRSGRFSGAGQWY